VVADRRRGRGALSNGSGRLEPVSRVIEDDGWDSLSGLEAFKTVVTVEKPKVIITRNQSPDISFDRSINPYRGCEHGCVYCFARPTHAYMGLSAGLDFETRLFAKHGAGALLERELSAQGYQPRMIAIGTNTDPYQPIEREHRVMREVLEVLAKANHPVGIVTKSALVLRDLDLLAPMAAKGLVKVALSVTTLDAQLARRMEPRAATPAKRLDALRQLSEAGVPTMVMVAPIVPALNDAEIEDIEPRRARRPAREEEVGRLEVAVDDAVEVRLGDGDARRRRVGLGLGLGARGRAQRRLRRAPRLSAQRRAGQDPGHVEPRRLRWRRHGRAGPRRRV
jgi:DNA repair photolyase